MATEKGLLGTAQSPSSLPLTKTYRLLTKVQNTSAVIFSTFVAVHGAQVLVANIGGTRTANNWIILGRPFYQAEHLEGLLVTGSAITHVIASLSKLGIRYYWQRRKPAAAATTIPPTISLITSSPHNSLTYHRWAGYALIPLAGLHYYLVRSIPIRFYGDSSFIDFGYIAWGLQNKPLFTYTLHTTLVVAASYHFVGGLGFLMNRRKKTRTAVSEVDSTLEIERQPSLSQDHPQRVQNSRGSISPMPKSWVQTGFITTLSIAFISSIIIIGKETKKIPLRLDFEQMYKYIV